MGRLMWVLALLTALMIVPGLAQAQVTTVDGSRSFVIQARGESDVYEVVNQGRCRVLTTGTFNTDATIYTDSAQTTLATTLTVAGYSPTIALDTQGQCKFYAPTSVQTVDVIIYIDAGTYAGMRTRVDGLTRQSLKQAVFVRSYPYRVKSISFTQNTITQTSSIQLPAGAVATAAVVEVTTAAAGSTVSFGAAAPLAVTSFCNAQTTATAGFFVCGTGLSGNVGSSAIALTYQTTNNAIAGFLSVFYVSSGGN